MIRLTDEQWERIRKHFPEEHIPDGRAGRKPIPTRHVLEAVLWILNTGAQWHMLPQSYPNYKTVHRRFQTWCCHEILRLVLTDVANELRENGALNEEECFIDATFVMAKGGGSEIGPTKRGKGMKIMAIVDRHGLPLSVSTHAASFLEMPPLPCEMVEKPQLITTSKCMLKLVESLAVKAKRAKSTTVVFVPLGESGVSHCCSWCGKFAKGKPKGWSGYRAVDHTYPRGLNVAGDVCSDKECRISIQAKYAKNR